MSFFSKKMESYLGVDIGAQGIKLVELKKNKSRPQVWTYGIVDKNLDIHVGSSPDKGIEELSGMEKKAEEDVTAFEDARVDEYAELLKELMVRSKVQTKRATSSLPVSQVFHAVINFPKVEEKELDQLVRAETTKMIPQPIDQMQLVYQMIPTDGTMKDKYTRVLVTAAPQKVVSFYTSIFQKAGLQLQELETEAFALARSLVGHDASVSMLVDIGAERTNLFIIDTGLPLTHRSLKIGGDNFDTVLAEALGLDITSMSQVKRDLSRLSPDRLSSDLFMRLLDPIAKEIQYSFDLFTRQTGNENKQPEKIILTGGAALFPPLFSHIKKTFPMKVFVGDPWARTIYQEGLKSTLDAIGPRMAVAIGLALRNF